MSGARSIILIILTLLHCQAAQADSLAWHRIGGPGSLKREIIGLKSDMTNSALDAEALRACPGGYQSDNGIGFTKPDGSKWLRFMFLCIDPRERGVPEAVPMNGGTATIAFPGTAAEPSDTLLTDPASGLTYEVRLVANRDVRSRVVTIDLVVTRPGSTRSERNLIEPVGRWHGAEPFSFAASDLSNGASSLFGLHRLMPIQGSSASLAMTIRDIRLTDCASPRTCAFLRVTVNVGIQR